MNCRDVDELLGAYALDSLTSEEAAELRAHLVGCGKHPDAGDLRAVASRIAAAAEPMAAAPALRARVLDAIALTTQDDRAIALGGDALGIAQVAPRRARVIAMPRRRLLALGAIAAVLVAAVVGLAVWNIALQTRSHASLPQLATRATWVATLESSGGGASGSVIYYAGEKKAVVAASGLRSLDAARETYQLWAISGGTAHSLGTMEAGTAGTSVIVVPLDATGVDTIAVTIEPAGGSAQPTSSPIMSASV